MSDWEILDVSESGDVRGVYLHRAGDDGELCWVEVDAEPHACGCYRIMVVASRRPSHSLEHMSWSCASLDDAAWSAARLIMDRLTGAS